jgi:dihydrofolate reductase
MWVLPTPASLNRVTQSVRHVLRRHRRSRQTMADECRPGRPPSRRRRLTGGRARARSEKLQRVVCGWPNRFRQDKGQHALSRSGSERGTEVMGKVRTGHSTSLDGFIAGPNDGPEAPMGEGGERLLGWYFGGDTEYRLPGTEMVFKVAPQTAELLRETRTTTGALVRGRRTFDLTHGWGGRHPLDVPVFVVTHQASPEWVSEGSPFTFVSDGLESAVAQAKAAAGDKDVGVIGANLVQQCIKARLLDEIHLDMVPVVLGGGIGLFDHLGTGPIELESTRVIEGAGVTHLTFRVV